MSTSGNSLIDEDTANTVASGRETIGAMLSTAQTHLQKVFIVFVLGFIGMFYAMSMVVWPFLRDVTTSGMSQTVMKHVEIVAVTPFDVILLQAKIAMFSGIILAIPVLLYLGRDSIRQREWYPEFSISYWKIIPLVGLAAALFIGGLAYGYSVYLPLMFQFLAKNAVQANLSPKYGIVQWTEFVLIISLSFGLAAELPLIMSGLSYSGIVKYETFRDKWRYAILTIFVFGAVASPPDPFTQVMWAIPLVILYGFSLYLSKILVTIKRGSSKVSIRKSVAERWNYLLGIALIAGGATYLFFSRAGVSYVNSQLLPALPAGFRPAAFSPIEEALGMPRGTAILLVAGAVGLVALVVAALYYLFVSLEANAAVGQQRGGAPAAIDIEQLDAAGVRAAPPEVFTEMDEGESLDYARAAMEADQPEKAQAIFDRFDEANAEEEEEEEAAESDPEVREAEGAPLAEDVAQQPSQEAREEGNVLQRTAAGVTNAFTEDETTEDDIGGYYYDFAFILQSLTSKFFRIVGVFMLVLASVFVYLYQGGIGDINSDFTSRVPQSILANGQQLNVVTLHPVEALIFEVKISTLLAAVSVLPMVLYYSWPAMKERKLVRGNRNVFFLWGGTLFVGLIVGSYVGYTIVAPNIISWLVTDAHNADMLIYYRVKAFFWLVFLTTVGIGLLADVPVTMFLFHWAGIVPFESMFEYWRGVVIGVFAVAALVTPDSLYTMFLVAIPVSVAYIFGLSVLWIGTLGGRRA
ncbi:Sec-independent periplasmic protein translocase [Haladaptatus paucihalophilus DX253]|uniref:Sec-independent protein translocase protein TatC n=1 Tax=Haladaptatus paucihalophilus DX253 TaxID=797209 RepID=E7QN41_HALPU|nr:twin-arginine translocase subunit TatC [Haladaptatus paucihalophilus]EFW93836.1 Sec-independent periplasmic protein translocase [Haladaptatus paucihalophilus DX253]SHL52686.1 sec-independent protein translocase protein TatC [Haladaptatus paucihalophilus DX253]